MSERPVLPAPALPDLIICSRARAAHLLCSRSRRDRIAAVVSIGDPGQRLPFGLWSHPARRLRLVFDDVERDLPRFGYVACVPEQISELISFLQGAPSPLLVHCAAGISRSSAAGLISCAIRLGPGQETTAVAALDAAIAEARAQRLRTAETIHPNRRMIGLADRLLGREGALIAAHRARWPSREAWPDTLSDHYPLPAGPPPDPQA